MYNRKTQTNKAEVPGLSSSSGFPLMQITNASNIRRAVVNFMMSERKVGFAINIISSYASQVVEKRFCGKVRGLGFLQHILNSFGLLSDPLFYFKFSVYSSTVQGVNRYEQQITQVAHNKITKNEVTLSLHKCTFSTPQQDLSKMSYHLPIFLVNKNFSLVYLFPCFFSINVKSHAS